MSDRIKRAIAPEKAARDDEIHFEGQRYLVLISDDHFVAELCDGIILPVTTAVNVDESSRRA